MAIDKNVKNDILTNKYNLLQCTHIGLVCCSDKALNT